MKKVLWLALGATVLLAACNGKKTVATVEADSNVLVKTAPAESATVEQVVELTANIEPWKQNAITPAVQGVRIDQIRVDVGDRVHKGQLLVTMDPTQYNQANIQLKNYEADLSRLRPVYDKGGISRQQLDQMQTQVDVQRDIVENLRKNIELRSPIDGVVTGRNDEAGNLFSGAAILELMQIDPLKITVDIPEQYFSAVHMQMPVDLKLDVFPDASFTGRVSLIYPALDAATRTFTVEVTVPNGSGRLRPGMFARASFNMGDRKGVLVPDTAIKRQSGTNERMVFVILDGKAERRVVKTGRQVGDRIDILSGVTPGEQVATTSLTRLEDGTPVDVRND